MACNVIYFCKKTQIGTLAIHNIKINNEKWRFPDSSNPNNTEDEIINMARGTNCNEEELALFGFEKGWLFECPE